LTYVEQAGLQGNLFNDQPEGGFITWFSDGRIPVFMDGRYLFTPLFGEMRELNRQVVRSPRLEPWSIFLSHWNISYAIVDGGPFGLTYPNSEFKFSYRNVMFPRADWALVYW